MRPSSAARVRSLVRILGLALAGLLVLVGCGSNVTPEQQASPTSGTQADDGTGIAPTDPASLDPGATATPEPTETEPTESAEPTVEPSESTPPVDDGSTAAGDLNKLAFAHYFTPFGLSDNKPAESDYYTTQWLNPRGENGKHAAYGGFLRDRPIPRQPLGGDWRLADLETEVTHAQEAGLDGFTLDLLSASPSSYNYARSDLLLDAAQNVEPNFKIMLMPDVKSLSDIGIAGMADLIAHFAQKPSAFRLADGRLVVSPFFAEGRSADWWSQVLNRLQAQGISTAFVPTFLDWRSYADSFAPISYGFSNWGNRNPRANSNVKANGQDANARGKMWMQPISVQDERPNQGIFDEAGNTENLRRTWQAAIDSNAQWVQYVTWNDWSEGTSFAPSIAHGTAYVDLAKRYLTEWKTGQTPAITRDTLFLSHRRQFADAKPSFPQSQLMRLRSGSTPARDTVEVVSWLTAPGTVTVTVGGRSQSFSAPAGQSVQTVPLAVGSVSASVSRDGSQTAQVQTPAPVEAQPYVQDLQYVAAESG